ncbi:hypothetical protein Y032_0214g2329 [Ancylostoma ceylanicum]|nr:hypothetical protein Y032_0214g2329 [Ancylostoma ceylanicum]
MLYEFKLSHSATEAARNMALVFGTDSPSERTGKTKPKLIFVPKSVDGPSPPHIRENSKNNPNPAFSRPQQMHDRWLLILSLLPVSVHSLSCYICGDSNLDEFGECATQFQYDCQSYASRFPSEETIYCRTTRHRAPNNTYTIMKECISEQDHYHTFPNKGYPIDEECDLVEVQGEEIAYCLCRNQNLCNKPTIADQFIAFEEKHPELFGDAESSTAPPAVPTGAAPLPLPMPSAAKVGFGAPLVAPPPIIPINDPRAKLPGIESEIRRAQLPTREHMPDFSVATGDNPISLENGNLFHLKPSAASQGQFIGSIGMNRHAVAVPPAPPAPPTMKPAKSFPELKCAQCGQTGLRSADADCEKQTVVRCQDSDAVCFTRQITIGPGQSAVEKMCVSWQAVQAEFPSAAMDSCGDSSEGQVRYCVCTTDECNSMAISLQITKDFPVEMLPPPVRTAEPEPALPPLPASPVARVPSGAAGSLQPEHTPSIIVPVPSTSSRMEEMDSNAQDRSQDKAVNSVQLAKEPSGRELQSSSAVKPSREEPSKLHPNALPQPIEPVHSNQHFLKCSACVESGMTDPTADCSTSAPAMCSAHEEYCLTKQTQNDDGTFTMEKRCVAQTSLVSLTESTDVKKGCATANGGMINYCLCQGDLCNQDSLLAQAQVSGVRKPELPSKPQTPPVQQPPKVDSPKPSVSNMPTVFLDNDEAAGVQTETVPTIRITDEERELIARQREWAEADLTRSSRAFSFAFVSFAIAFVLL